MKWLFPSSLNNYIVYSFSLVGLSKISLSCIRNDLLFYSHASVAVVSDVANGNGKSSICLFDRLDSTWVSYPPSAQHFYSISYDSNESIITILLIINKKLSIINQSRVFPLRICWLWAIWEKVNFIGEGRKIACRGYSSVGRARA